MPPLLSSQPLTRIPRLLQKIAATTSNQIRQASQKTKPRILIATPLSPSTANLLGPHIDYRPELAKGSMEALLGAFYHLKPDKIVVGNNLVPRKILKAWANTLSKLEDRTEGILYRRGTSLDAIDWEAALDYSIGVKNTPVNPPFVAQYITGKMKENGLTLPPENSKSATLALKTKEAKIIAVIGTGPIGRSVAKTLAPMHQIALFSRSLPHTVSRSPEVTELLNHPNIAPQSIASDTVKNADYTTIALNAAAEDAITIDVINNLKVGSTLIIISESKIFSPEALERLIERAQNDEIKVIIDTNPRDKQIYEQIADGNLHNIRLSSEAMQDPECQRTMDQAVLSQVSTDILRNRKFAFPSPVDTPSKNIIITGGGVAGLVYALILSDAHKVTLIDKIHPANPTHSAGESTSWANFYNCRHASVTEWGVIPIPERDNIYTTPVAEGGRSLGKELNPAEKKWIQRFNELTGSIELQKILSALASTITQKSLEGWKVIFEKYPELLEGTEIADGSKKIVRIFSTPEALEKGYLSQLAAHSDPTQVVKLSAEEVKKRFPAIAIDTLAGGIEVPGFTIGHQTFMNNLIKLLKSKNVNLKWDTEIKSIHDKQVHTVDGTIMVADHIIVTSIGNPENSLVPELNDDIMYIAGGWTQLPYKSLSAEGFKIHPGNDSIGVINTRPTVTNKGESILCTSGGFGFVGHNIHPLTEELQPLTNQLEKSLARYLPEIYNQAKKENALHPSFCLRPTTVTGLPIYYKRANQNTTFLGAAGSGGWTLIPFFLDTILDVLSPSPQLEVVRATLASFVTPITDRYSNGR